MYEYRLHNVDELKLLLIDVWNGLQQNVIDSTVSERRKRLNACYVHRDDILKTHYKTFLTHIVIKTASQLFYFFFTIKLF